MISTFFFISGNLFSPNLYAASIPPNCIAVSSSFYKPTMQVFSWLHSYLKKKFWGSKVSRFLKNCSIFYKQNKIENLLGVEKQQQKGVINFLLRLPDNWKYIWTIEIRFQFSLSYPNVPCFRLVVEVSWFGRCTIRKCGR